jgi:hypothetical protein
VRREKQATAGRQAGTTRPEEMATPAAHARKSVKTGGPGGMLAGRRNRQETMLSIRKAKKEDAYATRRNLKANFPRAGADAAALAKAAESRKALLLNLAARSQALLLGACVSVGAVR